MELNSKVLIFEDNWTRPSLPFNPWWKETIHISVVRTQASLVIGQLTKVPTIFSKSFHNIYNIWQALGVAASCFSFSALWQRSDTVDSCVIAQNSQNYCSIKFLLYNRVNLQISLVLELTLFWGAFSANQHIFITSREATNGRCPLRANNFKSCPAKWSITVSIPFPNHLGSIQVCPNFSCREVERHKSERSQLVFVIFLKVKDTFWLKVSFGRREFSVFQVLDIFGFFKMLGCPVS